MQVVSNDVMRDASICQRLQQWRHGPRCNSHVSVMIDSWRHLPHVHLSVSHHVHVHSSAMLQTLQFNRITASTLTWGNRYYVICEVLWWVCLSVCLSVREDISGTTRAIFTNFFVHAGYVHGSVLLRHVDDRPHCLLEGRGWRECTARAKCNLQLLCCTLSCICMTA